MKNMTIGQLAQKADVNIQTVRYYERRGLLLALTRTDSGYRQYTDEAVNQLRFIKRAQQLGFSLEEIKELLSLRVENPNACLQVKERAELKLQEVEEKLSLLQQMQITLTNLIHNCEQKQVTEPCPILDVLSTQGEYK